MKQFKPNQVVEAIREIGERTVMEGTSFISLSYTPEGIDVVLFERDEVTLCTDMNLEPLKVRNMNPKEIPLVRVCIGCGVTQVEDEASLCQDCFDTLYKGL